MRLGPGDVFFEPGGVTIDRFDAGADGATALAFFPLLADQDPTIEMLDG